MRGAAVLRLPVEKTKGGDSRPPPRTYMSPCTLHIRGAALPVAPHCDDFCLSEVFALLHHR